MDTTSRITMQLLEDLCSGDNPKLTAEYQQYYESLDESQTKEVVSFAIKKLIDENNGKFACEFGDTSFTLSIV